nr:12316_t:CDS:2 [Entrophospora candida]
MVKAARLLNYDLNIIRIPCFAHTLQLVVNKALKINTNIQSFVLRCKRLINFFTTPKQKENLEKMQKELSYPNIHTVIQDISTRWNSSFYSWRRLIDLQSAVTHLPSKLMADLNKDNKKDGKRLERIMLNDSEWILMNDLVQIFSGFEELTRKFSGKSYVTFSVVYPLINSLKEKLNLILNSIEDCNNINISINQNDESSEMMQMDEEDDSLLNIEVIPDEEEADELIVAVPGSKKKINISRPIDTNGLKVHILKNLLLSIDKYWDLPSDLSFISSSLDPRLKKLNHLSSTQRENIKLLLQEEYQLLKNNQQESSQSQNNSQNLNEDDHRKVIIFKKEHEI